MKDIQSINETIHLKVNDKFDFVFRMKNLTEKENENYNLTLDIFNYIFSLGEDGKTFLWNRYIKYNFDLSQLCHIDFSDEVWKFFKSIEDTKQGLIDKYGTLTKDVNINLPIETNHLILKPFDKETSKIYDEYFFQHKSEYTKYYYDNYGNEFRYNFMENKSLGFVVFLKDGNTQIGSVGLTYCGNTKYNVEYFIMKDFRQKGYAYEALTYLINEIKNNNLLILADTLKTYVYDVIHTDIRCLQIISKTENTASQRIAEKSGFKKYGTLLFTGSYDGKYYDDFVYYLVLNEDRTDKLNG